MKVMDAYAQALERWPKAARTWVEQVAALRQDAMERVVEAVPEERMTMRDKEFALRILSHNRGELIRRMTGL